LRRYTKALAQLFEPHLDLLNMDIMSYLRRFMQEGHSLAGAYTRPLLSST
jgi:hypothetical protein